MKRSKYGAIKKEIDWIKFDSKSESDYYMYLKENWIEHERQPKFLLQDKFIANDGSSIRAIYYVGDFRIWDEVVDVKWIATNEALTKRKLFLYKYPELKLKRIVKYWWERIDYFDNEKRKKLNKKQKSLLAN